jgi:hypothetical protein
MGTTQFRLAAWIKFHGERFWFSRLPIKPDQACSPSELAISTQLVGSANKKQH